MSRNNTKMRSFAERLVAMETNAKRSSSARLPQGLQICEELRPPFASLMGQTGFQALVMRAIALSKKEVRWLGEVRSSSDGMLEFDGEMEQDPKAIIEGSVELLTQLFGLLEAFVGESLTLRMVNNVWPRLASAERHLESKK